MTIIEEKRDYDLEIFVNAMTFFFNHDGVMPLPGDHVIWPQESLDNLKELKRRLRHLSPGYKDPIGRIEGIGRGMAMPDRVHVCVSQGSAFAPFDLHYTSISGGPFKCIRLEDLEPTDEFRTGHFWNWNGQSPGAGKGVPFTQERRVWRYTGKEMSLT